MTTVSTHSVLALRLCGFAHQCVLGISIDGDTAVAFTEDVPKRFEAYGWQVLHVGNGDR